MKEIKINSRNATFQKIVVLKTNRNKRYKYKEFFVEGVRNINEAIKNHWQISSFIYSDKSKLSDWAKNKIASTKTDQNYILKPELMDDISNKNDTSEILAIVKMKEDSFNNIRIKENPFIVLLDRPSNKGNLGTIIRSADALGIDGILITGHSVDVYDPDVITSSMGSFFNIPFIRFSEHLNIYDYLQELKSKIPSLQIIGTTSHNETNISKINFTRPTILMIGNETVGLSQAYKEYCDQLATIPMSSSSSASSFNIACATTVFFYEASRQRSH
ncbi:hypothetical protein P9693_002766 [Enterococcus faecalis]|jgi:TrmH family RNA methyltransferase|uniref:TrmH family RNA methyltransferase n=1 Tax=Bacillota TaxID=1239 RepID=UPI001180879E|nr:TrmH family RNA methyltransferase [Clostridioides difficile]EKR9258224.1 hypothetical protein [Enterococcus faecalis]MCJ0075569.1 hypothetical protein [Clostridioides difficile]HAP4413882.1 RNA methyltransferase [Enterococcus faecalis]HAP4416893.1 RNA methyltransferase [Enterococcus faecalis]HBF2451826.1 hypothetical protein [Clostridioides difficile]